MSELNAIVRDNLSLLDGETSSASERRLAQLADRAVILSRDDKILTSESRCEDFAALFDRGDIPSEAADAAKPYLEAYYNAQLLSDKLTVCKFLAGRVRNRNWFHLSALFGCETLKFEPLVPEDAHRLKICYLKNAYADNAFRTFSEIFDSPAVVYANDFTAVCEEVYYGRVDMCILPVDSSRDAKLISFCRLIDKYGLKIVLTCDVVSIDGVTTRYALARRALCSPTACDKVCNSRYYEFSFIPSDSTALADVLYAAESCGLRLYKVDAIPLSYSDSEFSYDVILSCKGADILPFSLFLAFNSPQYDMIGIYAHIAGK